MEALTRMLSLLEQQQKQQKDLADFLGINKNNITDWKSGKSKSYNKYLYQIATYLNTTPEYLKGETDIKEIPSDKSSNNLSPEELAIVKAYRSKSEEIKAAARGLLGVVITDKEV